MDMSLSKLQESVMDREGCVLQCMGSPKVGYDWATELKWSEPVDLCQKKKSKAVKLIIRSLPAVVMHPGWRLVQSKPVWDSNFHFSKGLVGCLGGWCWKGIFIVDVVQVPSRVWLFMTPWTAACQASLFFTISQSWPKFPSVESVMPSNHLILCRPLLLLPAIFPSSRVFSRVGCSWQVSKY